MNKILVIDDEPSVRGVIREILEYENYSVCEAGSGLEALEKAATEPVSLALLDVKMPGMDGFETLPRIKEKYDFPVIMVSAHITVDQVSNALKLGAYDCIPKPLDLNRLLISIRHAVEREELLAEIKELRNSKAN